jgi:hypothetical protein
MTRLAAYKSHNSGYTCADITGFGMRFDTLRLPVMVALMALALSSCARRGELPANSALAEDDDTFCRAGGKVPPGSPEYVACRKDRDAQRGNVIDRADKKQRDLGEYMLNNPSKPY